MDGPCHERMMHVNKTVTAKDTVAMAIATITYAIKRKGLSLQDFFEAAGRMADKSVEDAVVALRGDGMGIKAIARKLRISDHRVSAILKDLKA